MEKSIYPAKIFYIIKTTVFGVAIAVLMFYFIPAFGITPKTNLFIDASMVSVFLWIWRIIYQKKITKGSKIKIFFLIIQEKQPPSPILFQIVLNLDIKL